MIIQRLGVPIYLQVKSYILDKIKAGEVSPGTKLPTERDLANQLGISRNTVSTAYKELLLEGVLEARQGRGTFVKHPTNELDGTDDKIMGSRRERALKIIDEAIIRVLSLGFTVEQFIAIAGIRAKEKAEEVKELRVAIVDNTPEYINRFINQLQQVTNAGFEAVLLADLIQGKVPVELLQACDLVITSVENQAMIAGIMGNSTKLMAVSTMPNLAAVVKLARLPAGTTVGIVAQTKSFVETLTNLLARTAIENVDFAVMLTVTDQEQLRRFVEKHEVLVVAEERETLVRQLAGHGQDIIPFYYEIDQGSLNQLVSRLMT